MTTQIPAVADIGHAVQFYRQEPELLHTVGRFVGDGIRAGGVSIVIATEAHSRGFDTALGAGGIDPRNARRNGSLVCLDAAATTASFMSDGRIDRDAFRRALGRPLRRASAKGGPVRAYGEMVALLWDAADVVGAIELETLWNELRRELGFSLLCGYHRESVSGDAHADALAQVCRLHSTVVGQFSNEARAPADARRLVADALAQRGHDGDVLDAIAVVVSELATNAVRHAQSPFSLQARFDDQGVRISVGDESQAMPRLRGHGPLAASGRGLPLVDALSSHWGVDLTGEGKTIWAQFALGS